MPIDYSTYHYKWKLISYFIRHYRAKDKCEWCGAENGEPHPVTGSTVILTVAHIDQDKRNNRFHNLAALCQRCHLGHDKYQHARNRKYGRNHKEKQLTLFPTPGIRRQLLSLVPHKKTGSVPLKIVQFIDKYLNINNIACTIPGHYRDIAKIKYLIIRVLTVSHRDTLASRCRDTIASHRDRVKYLIIRGFENRVSRLCPGWVLRMLLIINELGINCTIFSGTCLEISEKRFKRTFLTNAS